MITIFIQEPSVKKTSEEKVRKSRLLAIDQAIREEGYPSLARLAEITGVNPRTIQRDIEYLRDMYRAPLEYNRARNGYYYTEKDFFVKSITLSEGELFSIALFDQLLEQYRNTPLEKNHRTIFEKIVRSMPDTVTVDSAFLNSRVSVINNHSGIIDQPVFEAVFTALKTRRTLAFEYRPLQKTTHIKRRADPYHVIFQQGAWYFIGRCHDKGEPRMFAFSRVRKAALTSDHFPIPADFDPRAFFDAGMGVWASSRTPQTIELLVDREIATFALERQWHDTQIVRQREDGSVYVRFTTTQTPEVLRWVLGQGHTVTVLNPPELIAQVKAELEKTRKKYKNL
jgi:predicted DNA-binding transcriptional regulator YafY